MLTQRPKREYHQRGENEYQHQGLRGAASSPALVFANFTRAGGCH